MLLFSLILLVSGPVVVQGAYMGNCTVESGCEVSVVKAWESSQRLLRDMDTSDNQVISGGPELSWPATVRRRGPILSGKKRQSDNMVRPIL